MSRSKTRPKKRWLRAHRRPIRIVAIMPGRNLDLMYVSRLGTQQEVWNLEFKHRPEILANSAHNTIFDYPEGFSGWYSYLHGCSCHRCLQVGTR